MTPAFGMVLGPWSHAADGGERLERAAGEVGLDHVTVVAVGGPLAPWQLDERCETPLFETEGGWHFPPLAKHYAAVGIRPVRARWLGSRDVLEALGKHARRLGLRIVARVDVPAVGALAEAPALGRRSAWGQEVPSAGLCPCNPSVRELIRATLDDLRRYDPVVVELADSGPDRPLSGLAGETLTWHLVARELAGLCFCAACRQIAERAGVDAVSAARSARVSLGLLAGDPAARVPFRDDPVLGAYLAARSADHSAWLRRLADGDTERRLVLLRPADAPDADDSPLEVVRRCASPTTDPPTNIGGWSLPVWRPAFGAAAELVRWVSEAVEHGARWFDFEGLDAAPLEAVTWLRQAVRYARRGP